MYCLAYLDNGACFNASEFDLTNQVSRVTSCSSCLSFEVFWIPVVSVYSVLVIAVLMAIFVSSLWKHSKLMTTCFGSFRYLVYLVIFSCVIITQVFATACDSDQTIIRWAGQTCSVVILAALDSILRFLKSKLDAQESAFHQITECLQANNLQNSVKFGPLFSFVSKLHDYVNGDSSTTSFQSAFSELDDANKIAKQLSDHDVPTSVAIFTTAIQNLRNRGIVRGQWSADLIVVCQGIQAFVKDWNGSRLETGRCYCSMIPAKRNDVNNAVAKLLKVLPPGDDNTDVLYAILESLRQIDVSFFAVIKNLKTLCPARDTSIEVPPTICAIDLKEDVIELLGYIRDLTTSKTDKEVHEKLTDVQTAVKNLREKLRCSLVVEPAREESLLTRVDL